MMNIAPTFDLKALIEAHRAVTGLSRSAFGTEAVGDPSFLNDLESGREPRRATVQRVLDFIASGKTHAESKGAQ